MAFRDLDEFLVVRPIVLPIHGKDYSFPGPGDISARTGLLLQRISATGGEDDAVVLTDKEDNDLRREVFGGLEDAMVADGLTFAQIRAAYFTLIACHLYGLEAGEHAWEAQGLAAGDPGRDRFRSGTPDHQRPRQTAEAEPAD